MARTHDKDLQGFDDRGNDLRYWIGFLLPPVAWAIQLQTLYLTSEYGCFTPNFIWNHVVCATALLLSIAGGLLAWQNWTLVGANLEDESSAPETRKRFMSILGMLTSALFTALIFAQWLPTLVGVPCEK
jgi:hypothetical protein